MTLQQALRDKYHKICSLSDLHGKQLELNTTTCGIVRGVYQYDGLIVIPGSDELVESELITLKNVTSESLLKAYKLPALLKNITLTFTPEQVNDIVIYF